MKSKRDLLDIEVALHLLGDRATLRELGAVMLETAPRKVAELRLHVATGDLEDAARISHGLVGSASNVGANQLAASAHRLERAALEGSVEEVDNLFIRFERCWKETAVEMERLVTTA
jgi:HPt (histidine-containing phosphotransfer) domain-containing protein